MPSDTQSSRRDQRSLAELLGTSGAELQGAESAPLPLLFTWASRIHRHHDQVSSLDASQREEALALCRKCMASVQAAALFSANEDAEDLATADMKYLLAPYYLAEVLSFCPTPEGTQQRAPLVEEALKLYTLFLDHCQQYGMLGKLGTQLYLQEAQVGV
jgi:immunoglobulin-binding protein 1